jgi:hypothetical protein
MKKSSMKTAPKGSTPPIRMLKGPPMYQACSGTCRGISFVRTGASGSFALYPKKAPAGTQAARIGFEIGVVLWRVCVCVCACVVLCWVVCWSARAGTPGQGRRVRGRGRDGARAARAAGESPLAQSRGALRARARCVAAHARSVARVVARLARVRGRAGRAGRARVRLHAPRKTRGTEIPNHMARSASSVPIGSAADEPFAQMKKLMAAGERGRGWRGGKRRSGEQGSRRHVDGGVRNTPRVTHHTWA